MAKVSGKEVAEAILKDLEVKIRSKKLKPSLAIILAGGNPASKIYVKNKIKKAKEIGIDAKLFQFTKKELNRCLKIIQKLNADKNVHGIIIQHPIFKTWNFDGLTSKIVPPKDVDGFSPDSPFNGATALAVWEMLSAFAKKEGFLKTKKFLEDKKIVILGKGKTAGGPTIKLLRQKGFDPIIVDSKTQNRDEVVKSGDVVISATGIKHIVNEKNLKKGSFVIGVGVGKEKESKIYGDIDEEGVVARAKLYCPTIGGIGPLTIACLLRNVVESAKYGFI